MPVTFWAGSTCLYQWFVLLLVQIMSSIHDLNQSIFRVYLILRNKLKQTMDRNYLPKICIWISSLECVSPFALASMYLIFWYKIVTPCSTHKLLKLISQVFTVTDVTAPNSTKLNNTSMWSKPTLEISSQFATNITLLEIYYIYLVNLPQKTHHRQPIVSLWLTDWLVNARKM